MGKAFDPFELNLTDDEEDQDLVAQPTIQSTTPAPDPEPAAGVRASGGFDPFAIDLEDEPEADRGLGSVFGAGVKSGVENYQETYELSRAWGNKITGDDEEAVEWYEKSQEHSKKAEAASAGIVTDFRDIGSWGDLGEYAAFTIGNLVPSMAESVVAGLAGAAIGTAAAPGIGTIGGGAVGAIAKGAAKKKLAQYAAANIAKGMAEDVAEAAAKKAVQAEIGGGVAMFFSSAQQGLGEVYGETVDEKTKLGNAEAALVGAPFFALADIVTEVGVLGRLTKDNGGEAVVKRFLKNFVVDTQKEGFAEVAQEGVTVLAGLASGKTYTSDDLIGRFGNSYFGGALGGGAMSAGGGVASAMRKRREASPIERTLDEHSDPETGLISLKALPRALVERIYEERPDAVREGGLFSAPKIHRGVIDDMHKQDAGQIEPEPEKDLDHDVERLMAAQNAEELDAVVQEMLAEPAPAAPQQEQTAQATEQVPQNLTRRGDGNPFSTAAAANAYAQSQGFGGYSVVEDGAGYALVRGDTAPAPAGPEDAARAAMAEAVSDPAPAPAPAADIAPDQEYIPLTHWGKNAGMQQLDPEFHGTAAAGGETSRAGKDFLPRTYYGMPGYKAEPVVLANAKARYFTKVKKSDLYDIENDPLNLRDIAKRRVAAASASSQVAFGGWSIQPPVDSGEIITQYENEIRKAGFKGYFSAATKTVAMFEAAPVVEITTNPSEQVGYAGWDEMGSVNPPSGKVTPMPVQDEAGAAQEPATASAGTTTSPTAETPQKGSEQPSGGADKKADKKNVEKAKFDEFRSFFSNVTKGAEQHSDVPFVPDLVDIDREVVEVKEAHSGNFDDHIKKSIPTFYEAQIATIKALGKVLKKGAVVLDIAASEGSWGKALTQLSGVKTVSLDPNPDMAAFFEKKSQVPGATYSTEAFGGSWVEDDGTEVKQHNPAKKYDAIHESMGFQFISPDRAGQIAEVRRLLAPGGILLTEQKLKGANWKANEEFKDKNHKSKYFDAAMLAKKDAIVGFSGKKELTQSEHDAVTTGMVSNQVEQSEMEKILSERFAYVAQYWDSGNFKGYIATDSKDRFDAFLAAIPNLDSPYSGGPSVRVIQGKPSAVSRLQPGKLQDLTKQNDWAMLTAENAMGKQMPAEQNALRMKLLKEDLTRLGLDFADVKGKYGQLENSVFVSGITREQALKLSKKYQQDSVLMSEGMTSTPRSPPPG